MEFSDPSVMSSSGAIRVSRFTLLLAACTVLAALILTGIFVHEFTKAGDAAGASSSSAAAGGAASAGTSGGAAAATEASSAARPRRTLADVLLPNHLRPTVYRVKLQPFLEPGNFVTRGSVSIDFECLRDANNVTVHARNLSVVTETVRVVGVGGGRDAGVALKVVGQTYHPGSEFYTVHLDPGSGSGFALVRGSNYTVSMDFAGFLHDNLVGFYRSSYTYNNETKWLAVTQFQATEARRAFPCFDEPAYKARFLISLARREGMVAVSNMPVKTTVPVEGYPGWMWDQFEQSVPMSTYLVAFLVSDLPFIEGRKAHAVFKGELPATSAQPVTSSTAVDFNDVSKPKLRTEEGNEIMLRIFARRDALDQAEFARAIGLPILYFFETYFNVSYPLPKQDMVALPDMSASAMENWGLITYRESALLYDSKVSSARAQQTVAVVMAHELAHQWFGNLVTPKWWTDLWLNEGFASYLEYVGVHHVRPSWKIFDSFVCTSLQGSFMSDSYTTSHPISIAVTHPDDIEEIFDSITYYKGSAIIRMMDHFLGNKSFRRGLTNYLREMAFKNAEQDDLWGYMSKAAHDAGSLPRSLSVKDIMDTWTLQMGFPVVTVTRNYDNNSLNITQERFLLNPAQANKSASTGKFGYLWHVPISYTQRTRANFSLANTMPKFWMSVNESRKSVALAFDEVPRGDWVLFNVRQTGYYRVNYDAENWRRINEQLVHDHAMIDAANRAQILDDAFNLARAGIIPYEIPLNLTSYLVKETEYVPWAAALRNLAYLRDMLVHTSLYGQFKEYMISLLTPIVKKTRFETVEEVETDYENITDTYLSIDILRWACKLEIPSCLQNATQLFQRWMLDYNVNNPDIPRISPNVKTIVYCTGIEMGGEKEWDFSFQHFLRSNVASEQSMILRALGCTRNLWLLRRLLDHSLKHETGIRKQDAGTAFSAVARNELGADMAFHFLRNNFKKIKEQYGSGPFSMGLIKDFQKYFNLESQYIMFQEFQKTCHNDLGSAKRATDQTLDAIEGNIQWISNYEEGIHKWLKLRKLKLSGLLDSF